jgi:hypothetical protein
MTRRKLLWLVPLVLYASFAYWYTNTGGSLTPEEIRSFEQKATEAGFMPDGVEILRAFMASDTGRQFLMINNVDLNEDPPDVEGATPGESAPQLLGRYMEHMFPELFRRACHPVFIGSVVHASLDLVGIEGAEEWDQIVVMRYRSRRDLLEIVTNPVFLEKHEFKIAALTKTIGYPAESNLFTSDLRLLVAALLLSLIALIDIAIFGRGRN